jgi:hypothetical protein
VIGVSLPIGVGGIVGLRVSETEPFYTTELETHNTPQPEAFQMLVNLMASAGDVRYISSLIIISNTGSVMGVTSFQTTSPTSPGYLFTWGTTSTTGLTGITGTAYGVFFVTNIQSTVAGTIATIALMSNAPATAFVGAPTSPVTVVANQFVQVSVAIFTGFSSWSGTISAYGVSVSTVTVNTGFLQAVPFIYLPGTILRVSQPSYLWFISTLVVGTSSFNIQVPPLWINFGSSVQLIWPATITPSSNISASTISWIGVASPAVYWGGSTTTYTYYVTVQAILSSAVTFPAGVSHFFTLNALWTV